MMRFNFRKIASTAASMAMVGSTVAIAAAASWPAPYVDGGAADAAVVYGSSLDLSAVTDVTQSLSAALAEQGPSTGVPTGGDFVQLDKSSNRLNLGNAINGPFGTTVDDEDLEVLLADGAYTADDKDDFDFEQKITLPSTTFTHFRDSEYEDLIGVDERTPVLGFKFNSDAFIFNYTLDFLDDAESAVGTSGDLTDFEGSDMVLFGKSYYISDAKNGSSTSSFGTFTLLDSANTATVSEGETITVTTGGNTYDVSISFISSTETRLSVDGELTDSLAEGQTEKLSDGSYVGIRDITKLEVAGELGSVEFSIGSGKLELSHGSDVELNDDPVTDVKSYLYKTGAETSSGVKLDKVEIEWRAEDDMFLTGETEMELPGFGGIKFSMNDLVREDEETVTLQNDGDDSFELRVPVKDGTADINILYANSSGEFQGIGKSATKRLATDADSELIFYEKLSGDDYHEYAVVSYATTDEAESYLLSFEITEDTSDNRNETAIKNEVTAETLVTDKTAGDTFDIGDVSLTINSVFKNGSDEWVNLTAGSNVNFHSVYTAGGLQIYLPVENTTIAAPDTAFTNGHIIFTDAIAAAGNATGHDLDSFYLFMDGEDEDDNIAAGTEFNFTLNDNTDGELQVQHVNNAGSAGPSGLEQGDSNTYETYIVDDSAPMVVHYTDPDQDWAEVHYSVSGTEEGSSELYAEVFLTEEGSSSGGGGADLGNIAVMDDELAGSGMETKNLILVGGTCVNSASAETLGVAAGTCGEAWTTATGIGAGEWLIDVRDNIWGAGKIATVVAGFEQGDTVNAATALRTQDNIKFEVGNMYTGTTGSAANPVVEEA